MPDDAIIDSTQVETLRQLFNDEFKQLVQTFLSEFEEKEKILNQAIQSNDLETIVKTAHFLKGSSVNIGATMLGNCCRDIEMAGKQNDLNAVKTQVTQLQKIYPETKKAFLELIN